MTWAHGVMLPNVAPYQLGYTWALCIIHDGGEKCNPKIEKAGGRRKCLDSFPFLLYNGLSPMTDRTILNRRLLLCVESLL